MDGNTPGLEERVLEVLERWDRRLEAATAAWDRLPGEEQRRREVALEAGGESDEWVAALWNWWKAAPIADQAQLRRDVAVLSAALSAAAADGRLDGGSEESGAARHLLRALERMARILATD